MNINFGIIDGLTERIKNKRERYAKNFAARPDTNERINCEGTMNLDQFNDRQKEAILATEVRFLFWRAPDRAKPQWW